jgi:hypothetical protein
VVLDSPLPSRTPQRCCCGVFSHQLADPRRMHLPASASCSPTEVVGSPHGVAERPARVGIRPEDTHRVGDRVPVRATEGADKLSDEPRSGDLNDA